MSKQQSNNDVPRNLFFNGVIGILEVQFIIQFWSMIFKVFICGLYYIKRRLIYCKTKFSIIKENSMASKEI
jgi:hypothetical protein